MGFFDFFGSNQPQVADFWKILDENTSLEDIDELSKQRPVVLFKHSTRCSVSSMAKRSLEHDWRLSEDQVRPYFLDLIQHRSISNQIAEHYGVQHESPQILLIKNGTCIYHTSHSSISVKGVEENL